jgi:hypothetical protein
MSAPGVLCSDITVTPALELVTYVPFFLPSYVFEEVLIKIVVCFLVLPCFHFYHTVLLVVVGCQYLTLLFLYRNIVSSTPTHYITIFIHLFSYSRENVYCIIVLCVKRSGSRGWGVTNPAVYHHSGTANANFYPACGIHESV